MDLETTRLRLVAATLTSARADLAGRPALQTALGVKVPENWPPQFYDAEATRAGVRSLEPEPEGREWGFYYVVRRDLASAAEVVGIVGYKGTPADDGSVEIGYSILEQHQRCGIATEAAAALVQHAFRDARVDRVTAETLPELVGSIRVLERLGFHFAGDGSEPGVIRYELRRDAYAAASTTSNADWFLRTARLGFRRWTLGDVALARDLWGDAAVTRWIDARGPLSEAAAQERLQREIGSGAADGLQYWPIFLLATGEHVGCCGLRPYDPDAGVYELGVHLLARHWGQGYALEACRAAIVYGFEALGATALFAGHHPRNDASRRLLEKLGFRYAHDELYEPTGLLHPSYRLTREDRFTE